MCEIKNTIKFVFTDGNKPDMGEVANFVKSLDLDPIQVDAAYRKAEERALFVKFKCEEAMLHALTFNAEELVFHYADGQQAKVRMSHAQEFISYARIYGLPPEVPDKEVASVLGKYGKVKRIVREKFPVELKLDAYTGVRGVYMDVKNDIPTSLHFVNLKGNIVYPGNNGKCFLCKEEGHRMNSCPKRKARNQQKKCQQVKEQSGSTYAGAVAGGTIAAEAITAEVATEGTQVDNSRQETIEVLEEEISESAMGPMAVDISEDGAKNDENQNHPWHQLAVQVTGELKRRTEELKRQQEKELRRKTKKEEEEAKIKSPPMKKKKNFSLYRK